MDRNHQADCIEILMAKAKNGQISRRKLISAMGMMAALPLAMRSGVSWAADKPLVIVNWGGDAIDAYRKAWTDSFTKSTGIATKIDGSGPTEGAIKTQVTSGKPNWDVVDVEPFSARTLGRAGILQRIDYNIVDRKKVLPGFDAEFCVSNYFYSYVMAYDSQRFGANGPKTWADFWNVKKFPGKRTLYKWMNGMLEAALMADGVAPKDLYPLDVPRALRKIDELKPHIVAYWGSGAESQQLMIKGDASVGTLWNTRAMLLEKDSEGRVKWSYDNAILSPSSWGVLKDNPAGSKVAMQFIASAQDAAGQVELFKLMGNSPANPAARSLIPAELRKHDCASPENMAKQIRLDVEWYSDNYNKALDQFLAHVSK